MNETYIEMVILYYYQYKLYLHIETIAKASSVCSPVLWNGIFINPSLVPGSYHLFSQPVIFDKCPCNFRYLLSLHVYCPTAF